ncbi:LacI family DNA-binding transcriptional regulator [Salinibacter sp.]|uniref:LacI family DNA-binding transcriptional regulator n=1 Tax=Salinibacter sp. TaxID=2065818 RepID=UPI0021E790A1|nr:LacI family DNA-binding transcriptional regulator [Salinibacter sp.]
MPTLEDVASEADVSASTVSRVFNNPDKVHPVTRDRVKKAADTLGYQPSRVARRLRLKDGKASLIGLVIPDIQNPFFANVARGVEDVAQDNEYGLILSNSDEDPDKQKLAVNTLKTEDVDGVIVPPISRDDPNVKRLLESDIAVVCVDRRMENVRVDTILSDSQKGAYRAVTHLLELGHRRIGFIGGVPRISTSADRREGYEQALQDQGVPIDSTLVREGDSRRERGRYLTDALLDLDRPPTALFTGNNLTTLGALSALSARDMSVPEEISLVGYDDVPWAMALNPPPTVIGQPAYEMGSRAAELLLQRLDAPNRSPTTVTLQPELITRKSCGPPPGKR